MCSTHGSARTGRLFFIARAAVRGTVVGGVPGVSVARWRGDGRPQRLPSEHSVKLAPALRRGLSCAESACVTDLKGCFTLYVDGNEVYAKESADVLESDLQPLVGGELVTRMSKHDTNPANNPQPPERYRR